MDREAFLDQIATRLGRARQRRPPTRSVAGVPDSYEHSPIAGAASPLVQVFGRELAAVGGGVRVVRDVAAASVALKDEIDHFQARRVVTSAKSEFARFGFDWLWDKLGACAYSEPGRESETAWHAQLLAAEIGLTTVDCAIANTGSLVVTASPTRPRAISLLPTVHIAVLFASQIRSHLGQALRALLAAGALPSAVHVITGPSRTSDIENDLTIGVHGPSAVTAIVVEEDPA